MVVTLPQVLYSQKARRLRSSDKLIGAGLCWSWLASCYSEATTAMTILRHSEAACFVNTTLVVLISVWCTRSTVCPILCFLSSEEYSLTGSECGKSLLTQTCYCSLLSATPGWANCLRFQHCQNGRSFLDGSTRTRYIRPGRRELER